ncbi:hypothetical protein [Micromonospora purpureochromogenes]|uniref:Uncharacterized protein n=1 Tax=Micromonospora purpureochromogenes TaxID=47872 RepID=A0ABX2RWY1_9ACTN|nr:hypothetical protein [Micromonospora purpureochromogenes]NYF59769.1 hypothetical protein [Micromonospora purpureochromogenes]
MTSTSSTKPPAQWRQRGLRGLKLTWKATVRTGQWVKTRWEQLVAALQDAEPAAAPTVPPARPGQLVEQRTASGPLTVPARDYVFHFVVRATFTWSSNRLGADRLSWYAQAWTTQASQRARRAAAKLSRTLPATQAGKLEVALQNELARQGRWTFGRADAVVTCEPEISVELDGQVRELLRPYGEQIIKVEREYDVHRRRAESAERICRQWITVMELFVDSPAAETFGQDVKDDLISAVQQVKRDAEAAAEWSRRLRTAGSVNADLLHPHIWFDHPASPARDEGRANGQPEPAVDTPKTDGDQAAAADSGSNPTR